MQTQVGLIKEYLMAVYTRRRLFIIVAASVALLAVVASFFKPKVYEAKSTVFIERNVINSLMRDITITPSMDDRIRVLRYYMVSRDIVSRTLKEMDMDVSKRYMEAVDFENLVKKCQANTNISVQRSDLFFVSMIDPDPVFAKEYINTLVTIYVEENLASKREESYGANRFLTEQLDFYKKKLDEADAKILDFRKQTGIYSTVNEASLMAQIAREEEALKELKGRKLEINAGIKTIKQQLEMMKETSSLQSGSNLFDDFDAFSGEDSRIEQLQAKIDELLLFYNDQYPTVVKLREQIEELQKRQQDIEPPPANIPLEQEPYNPVDDPIYVDLKMRLNAAQSEFNALTAKENELKLSMQANQEMLRNFPQDKKALNDLERERVTHLALYEKLLQRVGVSEVSKQMEVSDKTTTFRIVDPAILPTEPVGIKRILLMLLGLAGGLGAGLGAVYIAEMLDSSIRGMRDLRELGVNVLAEIPFIWSDAETRLVRNKDKATLTFGAICAAMIGILILHDLLGMSFIDHLLTNVVNVSNLT